jgi:hypothetical protein
VDRALDEDEADEDDDVDQESRQQVALGVAGVDGPPQREHHEQLDDGEGGAEQPLDEPGGTEQIGVQRQRDHDRRVRLTARERSTGKRRELAVAQERDGTEPCHGESDSKGGDGR